MGDKHLVCRGATVYCNKSVANNSPATAVPLTITSQSLVVVNGGKETATDKDCTLVNMNFGNCNCGTNPPPPCAAVVQWSKCCEMAVVTQVGLKFLTEESEGTCIVFGGKIKIAMHGQVATPQPEEEQKARSSSVLSQVFSAFRRPVDTILRTKKSKVSSPPKMIAFDILDDEGIFVKEDFIKYVNLDVDQVFVDGKNIKERYQLGTRIRCKVKFDEPGQHAVTVSIVADQSNVLYSEREKNLNSDFNYEENEIKLVTQANGELIIDDDTFYLSQAGGNIYYLKAQDEHGNVLYSKKITTWRRLYYVEVKMKNLKSIARSLSTFIDVYKKKYIEMVKDTELEISHFENLGSSRDLEELEMNIMSVYDSLGSPFRPYSIILAYTDQLAVKRNNFKLVKLNCKGGWKIRLQIMNPVVSQCAFLWKNVVENEDWFISCVLESIHGETITIDKSLCRPISRADCPNFYSQVEVDLTRYSDNLFGTLSMVVNLVDRMRAGVSSVDSNIVYICTRAWWSEINTAQQNSTLIHEVGHQLGMVPSGRGVGLDRTANYYNSRYGHKGPHCHAGIPEKEDYGYDDGVLAKCVMFGVTSNNSDFCPDCALCIRKTDKAGDLQ